MKLFSLPPDRDPQKLSAVRRRMMILVANTVLSAVLYYAIPRLGFPYLPLLYLAVGAGLALGYVIYNRGFRTREVTPEMLPDELSYEARVEMIADGKRRLQRSRWVLLILLPIIFTLLIDLIYLFLIPEGLLG